VRKGKKNKIVCLVCGYEFDPDEAPTAIIFNRIYPICPNCHSIPYTRTLTELEEEEEEEEIINEEVTS
jgi:hypothetical protein